jgi:outer membrane protein
MKKFFSFSIFFLFSFLVDGFVCSSADVKSARVDLGSVPQKTQAVNGAQEKRAPKDSGVSAGEASEISKNDAENQIVVYYNMQDLAEKLDISSDFKQELEAEFDGRSKQLEKDIKDLEAKGKELEKKKDILSEEAMKKEITELNTKGQSIMQRDQKLREDYSNKIREVSERTQVIMNDAVQEYLSMPGHEYYLVVPMPSASLANNKKYDVTAALVKICNDKHSSKKNKLKSVKK